MKFSSRKDFLHIFLTILCIIILWLPVVFLHSIMGWFYYTVAGLVTIIFVLFSFFVSYEINDKHLVSKFLFIKFEVDLDRLTVINKTKNFYLSFATAYERLEIRFGYAKNNFYTRFYVSPQNQDNFIKLLKERCPEVKIFELDENPDPVTSKRKRIRRR